MRHLNLKIVSTNVDAKTNQVSMWVEDNDGNQYKMAISATLALYLELFEGNEIEIINHKEN